MTHAHFNDEDSNTSLNPAFEGVLKARLSRRGLLRGGAALGGAAALGGRPARLRGGGRGFSDGLALHGP